ncbi:LysR family transcriptional regulator [Sporomusa aerivorans]|uniref:LysR family transcriptional regulator n=1 Tax=Sporomusa aerivorans TaxID=204936 RepID=UPI00352BA5EA
MDFRQLQYILQVAEERSFSKAAQKLYIAQPSLSQFIHKLEQRLGIQLFDRSSSPLRLTFAGELYVETAKRILDLKDLLSQQIDDIAELKKGRLTIGISPFRSAYILPSILLAFQQKFPGIEIILIEANFTELESYASNGTTDLSIMTLPIREDLFAYTPLLSEELVLALPPHHPAQARGHNATWDQNPRPRMDLTELHKDPFIVLGQRLHQTTIELCRQAGFEPRIILETKSAEAAHAFVAAGVGVAFIPDTFVLFSNMSERPLYFSVNDPLPTRKLVAAYRAGKYLPRAAQEFIAIAQETLRLKKTQV